MANLYIGLNRGQEGFRPSDFTVGSSTGSTDVELRIDDSKSLTRKDVANMLCAFARYIESNLLMGGSQPDL